MESRQRRVKRQKRREEANGSVLTVPVQCSVETTPMVSLLDDVTNEINRLERDRKAANKLFKDEKNPLPLTDTTGKESVTTKGCFLHTSKKVPLKFRFLISSRKLPERINFLEGQLEFSLDVMILGLHTVGVGFLLGAINFMVTIQNMSVLNTKGL